MVLFGKVYQQGQRRKNPSCLNGNKGAGLICRFIFNAAVPHMATGTALFQAKLIQETFVRIVISIRSVGFLQPSFTGRSPGIDEVIQQQSVFADASAFFTWQADVSRPS